jgi:UDPglucose 6-dehydrogenase
VSEVAVVGAGYVGLTTAACLSRLGHSVVCADLDHERVRALSKGEVPILEEGLPALVAEGLSAGRLRFVVGATGAARSAEFVFLCVQTPQ